MRNIFSSIKDEKFGAKKSVCKEFHRKMLKNPVILVVLVFAAFCGAWVNVVNDWNDPGPRRTQHGPTIRTPQGWIRGEIEFYDGVRSHISYKGIPYGQGQYNFDYYFCCLLTRFCYQRRSENFDGVLHFQQEVGTESDQVRCLAQHALNSVILLLGQDNSL